MIQASVHGLQSPDYSPEQRDGALGTVFGVDTQLIADGTYFVIEDASKTLAACGGWSRRRTLFGSDNASIRDAALLDPAIDAAKIRAFFVHPDFARQGLGTRLLEECEAAAARQGFHAFELGATLTGERLYRARGYSAVERVEVPLPNGACLPVVRMKK